MVKRSNVKQLSCVQRTGEEYDRTRDALYATRPVARQLCNMEVMAVVAKWRILVERGDAGNSFPFTPDSVRGRT